jgi:hypothetical protein
LDITVHVIIHIIIFKQVQQFSFCGEKNICHFRDSKQECRMFHDFRFNNRKLYLVSN